MTKQYINTTDAPDMQDILCTQAAIARHARWLTGDRFRGRHHKLIGQNLSGANLALADMTRACLAGTNFTNANLEGANFNWSDISGANFSNASIKGTRWGNAYWIKGFPPIGLPPKIMHNIQPPFEREPTHD